MSRRLAPLAAVLLLAGSPASASVIITALESGPDVVFSGSGTINLNGLSFFGSFTAGPGVWPSNGVAHIGPSGPADFYTGISGATNFGSGGTIAATSGTGDLFGIQFFLSRLIVPSGYVSNSPLSGTATWAGATFASLGITPGTYVWTVPADSLTLMIVPEPSTAFLLAAGLVVLGVRRPVRSE